MPHVIYSIENWFKYFNNQNFSQNEIKQNYQRKVNIWNNWRERKMLLPYGDLTWFDVWEVYPDQETVVYRADKLSWFYRPTCSHQAHHHQIRVLALLPPRLLLEQLLQINMKQLKYTGGSKFANWLARDENRDRGAHAGIVIIWSGG